MCVCVCVCVYMCMCARVSVSLGGGSETLQRNAALSSRDQCKQKLTNQGTHSLCILACLTWDSAVLKA